MAYIDFTLNSVLKTFKLNYSETVWKFIKLEGIAVEIDTTEYLLSNVNKILGILASAIRN